MIHGIEQKGGARMRKYVWECDRCGKQFGPRVLEKGEVYLTRKRDCDIDLCEDCMVSLSKWFATHNQCDEKPEIYSEFKKLIFKETRSDGRISHNDEEYTKEELGPDKYYELGEKTKEIKSLVGQILEINPNLRGFTGYLSNGTLSVRWDLSEYIDYYTTFTEEKSND